MDNTGSIDQDIHMTQVGPVIRLRLKNKIAFGTQCGIAAEPDQFNPGHGSQSGRDNFSQGTRSSDDCYTFHCAKKSIYQLITINLFDSITYLKVDEFSLFIELQLPG